MLRSGIVISLHTMRAEGKSTREIARVTGHSCSFFRFIVESTSLSRFLCKRENDASYVGLDMEPLAGMSSCDWAMEKITPSQGKVAYHARPLPFKPRNWI